jgi:ubiquinone/menaquinone biosynthesis C-methylase UbiE
MPAHARRTAERFAAFFLPHLTPGMRVLDAGCGPGSITIGLADAIGESGHAVGVDCDSEVIQAAKALAGERSCMNVGFETADVYALPFADSAFDAVFCHALLQHLAEPGEGLRELRRVLRPGGVIGVADADHDGSIMWPEEPLISQSAAILRELRARRGGGDPRIGKRLRALLHEAGFERVVATVSANADGDPESTRRTAVFWSQYLRSPELRMQLSEAGLATEAELDAMAEAWLRWGQSEGAFWASFWCQAIGRAPGRLGG